MLAALDRAGGGTPLVIGDRLETDIAGAAALGWDSLLVLTGITRRDDLAGSQIVPTFVGDDLSALFAPPAP
jgi:ribonucleotide monophosphatase NagD (HAD superfamily)